MPALQTRVKCEDLVVQGVQVEGKAQSRAPCTAMGSGKKWG